MTPTNNETLEKNIILFDGVCHLCNHFVDSLVRMDRQRALYYAPIQGKTAQQILSAEQRQNLRSVIYYRRGKILTESDAVLQALADLGGAYKLFVILKLIPRFIRDLFYRWIAKHRYAWFGQRDFCRIATATERKYLLP